MNTNNLGFAQSELSWGDAASQGYMNESSIRKVLQGIKDIGGTRVRFGVQTGTWEDLDRAVNLSIEYGITPLLCLIGNPIMGYAQSPQAYAQFCTNVVTRYKSKVNAWEVFNEANSLLNNPKSGDPAVYVQYLKTAFTAIKAIQPGAASTVIVGGPIPAATIPWLLFNPLEWYRGLYAAGAKPYFDAAGYHMYADMPPTPAMAQWKYLTDLRELMLANGDGGKLVWTTEVGVGYPATGVTSPQMAADWLKIMLDAIRSYPWCGPLFVYSERNATPNNADPNSVYGAYTFDWQPKPQVPYLKSIGGGVTPPPIIVPPPPPSPPPPPKPSPPWWAFWTWFGF